MLSGPRRRPPRRLGSPFTPPRPLALLTAALPCPPAATTALLAWLPCPPCWPCSPLPCSAPPSPATIAMLAWLAAEVPEGVCRGQLAASLELLQVRPPPPPTPSPLLPPSLPPALRAAAPPPHVRRVCQYVSAGGYVRGVCQYVSAGGSVRGVCQYVSAGEGYVITCSAGRRLRRCQHPPCWMIASLASLAEPPTRDLASAASCRGPHPPPLPPQV